MNSTMIALLIGFLFGGALYLGGLADPDKIIGTLRLKDFHAMRTIAMFIAVGMLGVWGLEMAGVVNFSVKPAAMVSNAVGGALLGIGFGMTGYCPGTGLACAAAGRVDALVTVLGMFAGALFYILTYDKISVPMDTMLNYGKKMLPEITPIPRSIYSLVISAVIFVVLILTSVPKKKQL